MMIKQISVFVENTTGRLAKLTKVLADKGIDLKAMTIAETVDFGILRCIVADPEYAISVLKENGFIASLGNVIAVSLENRPGGFSKVLTMLSDAGIAVEYIYSMIKSEDGEAVIMMKTADPEKAIELLKSNGVKLIGMSDI